MSKPVVISGIQPTGFLHIGNYLGALKNWVEIQNSDKYECFFFIADFHSLTGEYTPQEKKTQIFNLACDFLAAGIDPKKSTIFLQSDVSECAELAWIFNTITPIGELERMTQFKDKAKKQKLNVNTGLLTYPILQAADILIYHGEFVPVGQDQIQHLELTHDTVKWFNKKFKTSYFKDIKPLLTETQKVMSLSDPTSKMSKSDNEKSYISIDDSPESISAKISKAASTPEGIKNLKLIFNAFGNDMSGEFDEAKMSETKKIIAQGISSHFAHFRSKKADFYKNQNKVYKILKEGKEKAQPIAQKTIREVKEIIGLS